MSARTGNMLTMETDTPYEDIKEGQDWWKSVALPGEQKDLIGRTNAIRLFKLPLSQ